MIGKSTQASLTISGFLLNLGGERGGKVFTAFQKFLYQQQPVA